MSWPEFPRLPRLCFADRGNFERAIEFVRRETFDIGYSDMVIVLHADATCRAAGNLLLGGISGYEVRDAPEDGE